MRIPFLVIGGGLSGIAAAIRVARFNPHVLLVEKHTRLGGLNSFFYRNGTLFETGLHAITNYAEPGDKKAPLNRLLRQLKLRRKSLGFCQQHHSEVVFKGCTNLKFSNEFELFHGEIRDKFPAAESGFHQLLSFLADFDPFIPTPFKSAKKFLHQLLKDPLLVDMILCPLMYYGSSHQDDMDLSQFAIMFQAIYQEGMFRPEGTIKDFLDLLVDHYHQLGGTLRTRCQVQKILHQQGTVSGVQLCSGEIIECDQLLSTIGLQETLDLMEESKPAKSESEQTPPRLGFMETIYQVKDNLKEGAKKTKLPRDKTIIFYNDGPTFHYRQPEKPVDFASGVICFPGNFQNLPPRNEAEPEVTEIRSTHLANYAHWKKLSTDQKKYTAKKTATARRSGDVLENIIGTFQANIVYENSFTPVTIERYTAKIGGAIYGNPQKVKDGDIGYKNLFLAGTDQGFLGIIGSMLSGVSIVNQHILPKL